MIPHVDDETLRRIVDAADRGDNPLGIDEPLRNADAVEDAVYRGMCGLEADAAARVAASLKALEKDRRPTVGNQQCLPDLDAVTAELLLHMDIDPLMVAWMARVCQAFTVQDDDTMDSFLQMDGYTAPTDSLCDTLVLLDDVCWMATGTLIVPGLPDSTVIAAVGRPLRDVVSHPVLDRHPLTIRDCETGGSLERPKLITDIRHRLMKADDLVKLAPCGCR